MDKVHRRASLRRRPPKQHRVPFKPHHQRLLCACVQVSIQELRAVLASWAWPWTFFHAMPMPLWYLWVQWRPWAWIRSLNFSIVDDWRAWHLKGKAAGLSHLTPFFSLTYTDVYRGFSSPAEYRNVCQIKTVL
jgi:hypothetical protein